MPETDLEYRDHAALAILQGMILAGVALNPAAALTAYKGADLMDAARAVAPPVSEVGEAELNIFKREYEARVRARGKRVDPGPGIQVAGE